jgi:hypothetical protein
VEWYIGQWRRETDPRFKFRQAAPAPLYAEDDDEGRLFTLTALNAARLLLSTPEDRRSTDQVLFARILRLDPIMTGTYQQVQAFCRMVRQHHSADVDAWITEVQHTGVKALRAFVTGVLKDTAAVRAGLADRSRAPKATARKSWRLRMVQVYPRQTAHPEAGEFRL